MQLACAHCGRVLEFTGKRPPSCAYCGKSLSDDRPGSTVEFDREAVSRVPAQAGSGSGGDADPAWVGGYRLLRIIGEGGMGKVYEALDTATGRRVALKLIAAQYAGSPEAVERFRREGRLASALSHPRCVFVLAADEEAGRPYIVMELMPGDTLEDLFQREGPLPVGKALAKILDVIEGLKEAHRLGVVHRDVKPSNCFLEPDGHVKVGDFGLAKSLVSGAHLTKTGSFLGTLLFAAPEQIKGESIGPQADVYSVATTLYCLLTGQAPFQGSDPAATLARIVCDPPPPMRSLRPELPEALDQVVLRGLERDRNRRWHDLDAFEAALRPFVPGKLSLAGLGERFGVFLIDLCLLSFLTSGLALLINWCGEDSAFNQYFDGIALLTWLGYFATLEAIWGGSLAKLSFGLRVVRSEGVERPGPWRTLLRTGVFCGLFHLDRIVSLLLLLFFESPDFSADEAILATLFQLAVFFLLPLAVGVGLLVCPMRTRNGYRGLHEWASATRVIRLPEAEARRNLGSRSPEREVSHSEGLPARLGSFTVLGAFRVTGPDAVLLGEDPSLGRKVVLWLRPLASGASLSAERREINRTTRPRWLAGGRQGEQLWDAFLTPAGHPVPDVVATGGRLSWADGRFLLTQLGEELSAAETDETLPTALTTSQVWVQPDGRLQLLDVPLTTGEAGDALSLLRDLAVLALEGEPRPPDAAPVSIRAPLPGYAVRVLDRLVGCGQPYRDAQQFRRELADTANKPSAVTRGRRLAHLAVLAALLSFGIGVGLVPLGILPTLMVFKEIADRQRDEWTREQLGGLATRDAVGALQYDPFARYLALRQLQDDLRLREQLNTAMEERRRALDALRRSLSRTGQWMAARNEESWASQQTEVVWAAISQEPERIRTVMVRSGLHQGESFASEMQQGTFFFIPWFLAWPAAWVVWAFLWRGGLSFRLLGLALVREDGRPAWRLQCAWRALLFWVPVTALIVGSVGLDLAYWLAWTPEGSPLGLAWLAYLAWWAGLALFPTYFILALRSPERSIHDRLAGTYLVPR
jgi:hypothetical protein